MAKLTGQQLIAKAGKYHTAGKFAQAEKIYRQLLQANPNDLTIIRLLGMLERDRRNLKGAVDWFTLAKQISGDDPIILAELALTLEQAGKTDKAINIANEAIAKSPTDMSIALFFAKMCLSRGLASKAGKAIEVALDSDPNNPEAWLLLSLAANSAGKLPVPLQYAKKLIQLQPQTAQPYATLATAHRLNGDLKEALVSYNRALDLDKSFVEAVAGKAEVLESLGKTEEADILLTSTQDSNSSLLALAKARVAMKKNQPKKALKAIELVLHQQVSPHQKSNLLMHKGRVLEKLERYDEAWQAWEEGNTLHGGNFALAEHIKLVDTIIDSPISLNKISESTQPIFIVGMFRSGTTLLEQILGAHPEIDAAGEVDQILRFVNEKPYPTCVTDPTKEWTSKYLQRLDSHNKFCTDKMPMNYLHIGLIHTLFPNAKIIHTTRNPQDVCVSCFANTFSANHAYTSNLNDLANVYEQYQRIINHWGTMFPNLLYEVPYELLVEDLEGTVKGVLEHIGAPYKTACLEFYNVKRIAVTPSADQVRKPIYNSSVGRHLHFSTHLDAINALK